MPPAPPRPSPAGLTVLTLLGAMPLHPYGMQRLIKSLGKDEVVNIGQRANLYKTINRLHEAGLIAVRQTERTKYPERTVYELTEDGERIRLLWLRDMLGTSRNEYPAFPAALSFAMVLNPDEVASELGRRLSDVQDHLAHLDSQLESMRELPRIVLIETEYARAIARAEAGWLSSVLDDLSTKTLTWDHEELAAQAAQVFTQAVGP